MEYFFIRVKKKFSSSSSSSLPFFRSTPEASIPLNPSIEISSLYFERRLESLSFVFRDASGGSRVLSLLFHTPCSWSSIDLNNRFFPFSFLFFFFSVAAGLETSRLVIKRKFHIGISRFKRNRRLSFPQTNNLVSSRCYNNRRNLERWYPVSDIC